MSRRQKVDDQTPRIAVHARLVGEVIWAWNELHRSLAFVFFHMIECPNPMMGHSIWGVLQDRQQRDVLDAAMHAHSFGDPFTKRIRWTLGAVNKLSVYRNDFVHAAMGRRLGPGGLPPSNIGAPFGRLVRMHSADTARVLKALRGDLIQLHEYVDNVYRRKKAPNKFPSWPRRPVLRTPKVCPPIHLKETRRRRRKKRQPGRPL
jgi:hypothetical protein